MPEPIVCWSREPMPEGAPLGVLYLDIETRKVDVGPSLQPWPLRQRWQPFMLGYGWRRSDEDAGEIYVVSCEDEAKLLVVLETVLCMEDLGEIRYSATREFDEMVLRGRFTNARRAHSPVPGPWPNLDHLEVRWRNIRKVARPMPKAPRSASDCASIDVPFLWPHDPLRVAYHCGWDVLDLVRSDPEVPYGAH